MDGALLYYHHSTKVLVDTSWAREKGGKFDNTTPRSPRSDSAIRFWPAAHPIVVTRSISNSHNTTFLVESSAPRWWPIPSGWNFGSFPAVLRAANIPCRKGNRQRRQSWLLNG